MITQGDDDGIDDDDDDANLNDNDEPVMLVLSYLDIECGRNNF